MRHIFHTISALLTLSFCSANADETKSKPNVLLICIDDLRPELPSFGKEYIHAPQIEKLISEGRLFKRHYVQAPTCGASRFSLLTGLYPDTAAFRSNNAIVNFTNNKDHAPTLPQWLKKHGYLTMSLGKISHYPGGLHGKNWADPSKEEIPNAWDHSILTTGDWKTPQVFMHGIANGVPRTRGVTPACEATPDAQYPDDLIVKDFQNNIQKLKNSNKPWFCAVGIMKPHLPFATHKKYLDLYKDKTLPAIPSPEKPKAPNHWHGSGELMSGYSTGKQDPRKNPAYATELRKHYAACVSAADANLAIILQALEKSGQADNTIIILWGDHGFHLGEQAIWGKHTLYHVALHSPLIIKTPKQKLAGKPTSQIAETLDIYPTICDLCAIPKPSHLKGASLLAIVDDPSSKSDGTAISYWRGQKSIITDTEHSIINRKTNKPAQRYNLTKDPHESNNLEK